MSKPRLFILPIIALLSVSLFASDVAAQMDSSPEARRTFDEAARQFDAQNYALALQGFTGAYDQLHAVSHPRAGYLLYNIGRCNEELDRLEAARDAYRRYLAEADTGAPFRSEVSDRIQDLEARIGVSGGPGDSRSGDGRSGDSLSWVGWTLVGVGGVASVVGVITGVMALDRGDQLEARCPGFVCTDAADLGLIDEAETFAVATDVLLVAGLTVAAGGVVLALILDLDADSPSPTAGCSGDGCQVGLRQRF